MPKPTKGPRLGGGPAHERLLLANLSAALFTHRSIKTTETKAKRLRPFAERLVTFAKRGDLHARRRVLSVIGDKEVVHVLFTEIAPLVADREGGYTRITKVGNRKGDNAPMAVIELVLEPVNPKPKSTKKAAKAKADDTGAKAAVVTDNADDAATDEPVETVDIIENADGEVVEVVDVVENPDGSTETVDVVENADGSTEVVDVVENADGSAEITDVVETAEGEDVTVVEVEPEADEK